MGIAIESQHQRCIDVDYQEKGSFDKEFDKVFALQVDRHEILLPMLRDKVKKHRGSGKETW